MGAVCRRRAGDSADDLWQTIQIGSLRSVEIPPSSFFEFSIQRPKVEMAEEADQYGAFVMYFSIFKQPIAQLIFLSNLLRALSLLIGHVCSRRHPRGPGQ
jgi:hypothetical protein